MHVLLAMWEKYLHGRGLEFSNTQAFVEVEGMKVSIR